MKIEVITTEYLDGERIDTVKHSYTKADDYIRLGNLYYTLGTMMAKGEDTAQMESAINAQVAIIKGYGD